LLIVALVRADQARQVQGADDAAEARWWSMADLPRLAFDHGRILSATPISGCAGSWNTLRVGFLLLPDTFTLSELQAVVEVALGERLDQRSYAPQNPRHGGVGGDRSASRGESAAGRPGSTASPPPPSSWSRRAGAALDAVHASRFTCR
jgi:hypothetical protein